MLSSRAQRIVFWTGILFLASGMFHAGVWLNAGMPSLEGPVSWRKPMTFGFSTGILSLSIAWVLGLLPQTSRLVTQAWLFSALLIAEIALIDMQQWRGVASHFNNTTAFDGAVFNAMGAIITSVAVLIAIWTVALFRSTQSPERAELRANDRRGLWAGRAGMVMLNVGNLIGIIMAVSETNTMKPLHGIALHAIQAFAVAVWLATRLAARGQSHGGDAGRAEFQTACYPRAWRDQSRSARSLSSPDWRHQ
jgi:hypothetical protein